MFSIPAFFAVKHATVISLPSLHTLLVFVLSGTQREYLHLVLQQTSLFSLAVLITLPSFYLFYILIPIYHFISQTIDCVPLEKLNPTLHTSWPHSFLILHLESFSRFISILKSYSLLLVSILCSSFMTVSAEDGLIHSTRWLSLSQRFSETVDFTAHWP